MEERVNDPVTLTNYHVCGAKTAASSPGFLARVKETFNNCKYESYGLDVDEISRIYAKRSFLTRLHRVAIIFSLDVALSCLGAVKIPGTNSRVRELVTLH